MQVVIFSSPSREEMLQNLINELKGFDVFVIDSLDTFGKEKFWYRWEMARKYCIETNHDNYLIIPDDISNLDLDVIQKLHVHFKDKPFFCSVSNDGRQSCWGNQVNRFNDFMFNGYLIRDMGFFDCGGLTNRKTLSTIKIDPVPPHWFDSPIKSSGVGYQITTKCRRHNIPMYIPNPSLSYHGNHESVMHPFERKRNPLICKTKKRN